MGHNPPHDGVDTVASQSVAYLGGRIRKVAIHHSVQADDGSVWCFSEDMVNYEDNWVADHDSSWLTGEDGPGDDHARPPRWATATGPRTSLAWSSGRTPSAPSPGRSTAPGSGPRPPPVQEMLMDGTTKDKASYPLLRRMQARAQG
jgi:hypothetical protein